MNVASLKLKINLAVGLAKKGLHVYLCHPGTIEPIRPGMDLRASNKAATIRRWFRMHPEAEIAVNPEIAGQFVLYAHGRHHIKVKVAPIAEFSKPGEPLSLFIFDRDPKQDGIPGIRVSTECFNVEVPVAKQLPYCLARLQELRPFTWGSAAHHLGVAGPPIGPGLEFEQMNWARAFPNAYR